MPTECAWLSFSWASGAFVPSCDSEVAWVRGRCPEVAARAAAVPVPPTSTAPITATASLLCNSATTFVSMRDVLLRQRRVRWHHSGALSNVHPIVARRALCVMGQERLRTVKSVSRSESGMLGRVLDHFSGGVDDILDMAQPPGQRRDGPKQA